MTNKILFAGFGGQGILFAGKQIAKYGMHIDKKVSWLPSYGPEMRGGTANCSVIVSDSEIGSPIVNTPNILVSFNIQSFEKFEPYVSAGGVLFADSSLIEKRSARDDIEAYYIPATELASSNALHGGANVIMLGYIMKKTSIFDAEDFLSEMLASIPKSKESLIANNKKAFYIGYNYKA